MSEQTGHTGRRPKLLNPEIQQQIVEALLGGNYMETAAEYAGVGTTALYDWLAKGREAQQQIDNGEEVTVPNGQLYAEFAEAVKQAQARAEVQTLAIIRRASLDSWQAGAWWLERTRPRRFGRMDRQEISGPQGAPLRVDFAQAREDAIALLNEIAARGSQPD